MTTTSNELAQSVSIAGKNAVIEAIHAKMGICPYYGTKEILDDVLIQKESWGGKDLPENKTKLCAAANVEYMKYAESVGVMKDLPSPYYAQLFNSFIVSEKPELTEKQMRIEVLKCLVALRIAFMDERMAMEARIRGRGKNLDLVHPIEQAFKIKLLEKFRTENEPLLKEVQEEQEFSWQNLIGYGVAQMGYVQKTLIEAEIAKVIEKFPIWQYFGNFIPGFGTWTCAYLIAKLQDPTRFSDSGKVRAFAGIAPKGGQPMRHKRGEQSNYDDGMKEILCKLFPESFMKVAGKFPNEPYAKFLQECRQKQAYKAENATDAYIKQYFQNKGENVIDIINLGYEDRDGRKVFLGFKVKTDKSIKAAATEAAAEMFVKPEDEVTKEGYKHFLNPGQVLQRALRQFSSAFISDFYHAWLYFMGENLRVEGNSRIMAVFAKAKV